MDKKNKKAAKIKAAPFYLSKDSTIYFDCDDTIVMWADHYTGTDINMDKRVKLIDPYDGTVVYLTPHKRHIKLLKDKFVRGYGIIVWSANGAAWAKEVVRALQLEKYVHAIMTKPSSYVDDLSCPEFMGTRIYLTDKG